MTKISGKVRIIGMIGAKREAESAAGAALSAIGDWLAKRVIRIA